MTVKKRRKEILKVTNFAPIFNNSVPHSVSVSGILLPFLSGPAFIDKALGVGILSHYPVFVMLSKLFFSLICFLFFWFVWLPIVYPTFSNFIFILSLAVCHQGINYGRNERGVNHGSDSGSLLSGPKTQEDEAFVDKDSGRIGPTPEL